jgi:hypothetical protein
MNTGTDAHARRRALCFLGNEIRKVPERSDEIYIGKRVERMQVRGRKGRGRPKKRWKDCVNQDLGEENLSGHEVHNRAAWKRL